MNLKAFLDNKKSGMVLQRSSRMHQRNLKFSEDLNEGLVHLEKRKITADAKMAATTELIGA